MLIQTARPRLRPPGNAVLRVNRSHPLAVELRACIVTGGQFGVGRDLVTGAVFSGVNSPTITTTPDGSGADFSGTAHASAPSYPEWNTLGDVTVAWRGLSRNVSSGGALIGKIPTGGNGANNTPFSLEYCNPTGGRATFVRSNVGSFAYRVWQSDSAALTNNTLASISVSQGAVIEVAPTFYLNGVATTATNQYGSPGSGAPTGNSDPLILGRRPDGGLQHDGVTGIAMLAAVQWIAAQHQRFSFEPYGVLEEAPWWYFATPSATGPLSATIAGTVDITASVSAALALDATITGTVPITAQITATSGSGAGDTHDGYLRRSRRQRAIEAAERRREAERLADAQALRLELQAAMGMAADVVAEAPQPAVEAVREAVAVVAGIQRGDSNWIAALDRAAMNDMRAAIAELLAAIEAAQRAKALADDDEDVEILLRAL